MQGIDPGWKVPPELEGETTTSSTPIDELRQAMKKLHASNF